MSTCGRARGYVGLCPRTASRRRAPSWICFSISSPTSSLHAAVPLVVEDDRPGSGHMQVNHPAPCEGFFEPVVELGQRVQAGGPVGTVTDVLGRRVEPVHAAHAGIVLVLHTFARLDAEEGVAVILGTGS
jgi:hypothetical protein